jgi:DNA-directed RNA polymerase subunit E'/Rpb7
MINQKKRQLLYTTRRSFIIKMLKKAGIIVMNYETNEVYAGRIRDSTGKYTQYPNFKQGANEVQPDSIRFNFKTQKL